MLPARSRVPRAAGALPASPASPSRSPRPPAPRFGAGCFRRGRPTESPLLRGAAAGLPAGLGMEIQEMTSLPLEGGGDGGAKFDRVNTQGRCWGRPAARFLLSPHPELHHPHRPRALPAPGPRPAGAEVPARGEGRKFLQRAPAAALPPLVPRRRCRARAAAASRAQSLGPGVQPRDGGRRAGPRGRCRFRRAPICRPPLSSSATSWASPASCTGGAGAGQVGERR